MIVRELIHDLLQQNIILQSDGEDLLITGDTHVLTPRYVALLKDNKSELLAVLETPKTGEANINSVQTFQSRVNGDSYVSPVSNLQRNIYFLESLADGQSFYNIPTALEIKGTIDEDALRNAIASICQHCHILRTVYQYQEDELKQVIETFTSNKLPFRVENTTESAMPDKLHQQAHFCFDLGKDWPIQVVLFKSELRQVLCLTMHHIAIDGYSAKLIISALQEAYNSHRAETGNGFLNSTIYQAPQYAQYAWWHQEYLQNSECQMAREYWHHLLQGAPACHNFPLEFPRPSTLSVAGDVIYHQIKGAQFDSIKTAAKACNISVFLYLQSLFAGFMARLGDEDDLLISSVYANRSLAEFANTIGMFANTIPFRYKFDRNTDVGHLVQSTQQQHHAALRYQQFPFEMMLEGLSIERDPSYNPLVQVQFVLQEDALRDFKLGELRTDVITNRQQVAKFDFSVHLCIADDGINIQWEYNTNLFSQQRINVLLGYYLEFVQQHINNEFAKIVHCQFAEPSNSNKACKSNFDHYRSNPEIIEGFAITQPDDIAVIDGGKQLTYKQLVVRANRLIAGLQSRGVHPGERVAVYMDKSIEQVTAMYAVMRAGFVYVPLDPNYPSERLAYMCSNAKAKALVHCTEFVPASGVAGDIPLAGYTELSQSTANANLPVLKDDDPAYIIYTSGSTGKPKGVVVPHGSIYYSLQANKRVYQFQSDDIMPTVGSQAFGVSLLETFVPLISGGQVQILTKSEASDISLLIESTQSVTVMHMVPSLMAQWLDQIVNNPELYPSLRLLLVGAEPVPPNLLARLKGWREDVEVRVLYGMTESSVVSSGYLSHEHYGKGYSIGKPHPNMQFYTMNKYGVPQPVGVAGELYVGGLSLAQCYVDLPELTSEKFVQHTLLNERLYKTGDRARLLSSGHFEFMGRVDHQISLRGIRIETGEIESLVNQIEQIRKCIAHVVPLDNGDVKFVLYYTVCKGAALGEEQSVDQTVTGNTGDIEEVIRTALARDIPESMRPSIFQKLDEFPHNPNGKVDRTKLPKPTSNSDGLAPSTPTEIFLYELWAEMLELDQISILDSFFELGGHSLMATKLVNKINEKYNIKLPLRSFFEASNIQDCASVIDDEVLKYRVIHMSNIDKADAGQGETDEFVV